MTDNFDCILVANYKFMKNQRRKRVVMVLWSWSFCHKSAFTAGFVGPIAKLGYGILEIKFHFFSRKLVVTFIFFIYQIISPISKFLYINIKINHFLFKASYYARIVSSQKTFSYKTFVLIKKLFKINLINILSRLK